MKTIIVQLSILCAISAQGILTTPHDANPNQAPPCTAARTASCTPKTDASGNLPVGTSVVTALNPANVKHYGAIGDWNGSTGTDNTAAFQSAINAVIAAGGGDVLIPQGAYLTGPVTAINSTKVRIVCASAILYQRAPSTTAYGLLNFTGTTLAPSVLGCEIDGRYSAWTSPSAGVYNHGISVVGTVSGMVLQGNYLHDTGVQTATSDKAGDGVFIGAGGYPTPTLTSVDISHNRFRQMGRWGVAVGIGGTGLSVQSNVFEEDNSRATRLGAVDVETGSAVLTGITIRGNVGVGQGSIALSGVLSGLDVFDNVLDPADANGVTSATNAYGTLPPTGYSPAPPPYRYMGDGSYGDLTCSNGSLAGESWVRNFTVPATTTCTSAAYLQPAVIRATGTCTIAGTLYARGGDGVGATGSGNSGGSGGGGGGGSSSGTAGSDILANGGSVASGGSGGGTGAAGSNGATVASAYRRYVLVSIPNSGAAGGSGGNGGGGGGRPGGVIVLVCNAINYTGAISVAGANGADSPGNNKGAGGGGGGGTVIMAAKFWQSSTGTTTLSGGSGGSCGAFTTCGAGGSGGPGIAYKFLIP